MKTHSLLTGLTFALCALVLPASAFATDGFVRTTGTLRAGAGTDYPAIGRVGSGTALDVRGCVRRYTWCDVVAEGERGWFPGNRIELLRDGRHVRLSEDGAAFGLSILTFGMADYWSTHYADRPFYDQRRWWRGHGATPRDGVRPPTDRVRSPTIRPEPPIARDRPAGVHIPNALRDPNRPDRRREDRVSPHLRSPEPNAAPQQRPQQRGPSGELLLIPVEPRR